MDGTLDAPRSKKGICDYVAASPYSASAGALYRWLDDNFREIAELRRRDATWMPYIQAARDAGIPIEDDAKGRDRIRQAWVRVSKARAKNGNGDTRSPQRPTGQPVERQHQDSSSDLRHQVIGDDGNKAVAVRPLGARASISSPPGAVTADERQPSRRRDLEPVERTPDEVEAYIRAVEDGFRRTDNERNGYFERPAEPPRKISYEK